MTLIGNTGSTGNVPTFKDQTVSNVVPWYNQHREKIQNVAITLLVVSILTLVTAVLLRTYPHSSSAFLATFSATTVLSSCAWVIAQYFVKNKSLKDKIQNIALIILEASILTLVTSSLLRAYPHGSSAFIATFSTTTALSSALLAVSTFKWKKSGDGIALEKTMLSSDLDQSIKQKPKEAQNPFED